MRRVLASLLAAPLLAAALLMPGAVRVAAAQGVDESLGDQYRGGWETDRSDHHIYEFSIRGSAVRGIYCGPCDDATTLAFVDGTLSRQGLRFVVTHVRDDGSTAWQDQLTARLEHGELVVSGRSGAPGAPDGGQIRWRMHKDPRSPAPLVFVPVQRLPRGSAPVTPIRPPAGAVRRAQPPYQQPGPWEKLTPAKVAGVWLGFGSGIDKQFFIIRRVGDTLRGMVCGRCDNPWTMAALDHFRIDGDTLHFDILHEDWGDGDRSSDIPFYKHVTAHISQNEMRAVFRPDHPAREYAELRGGDSVGASLMGPIAIDATAGND
jgi:hypothetical protein